MVDVSVGVVDVYVGVMNMDLQLDQCLSWQVLQEHTRGHHRLRRHQPGVVRQREEVAQRDL